MTEEKRSRRRWLAWGLAIGVAAALIASRVVERAVDVDQYRPRIEHALEHFTGLPVSIGRLDLAWHPALSLSAIDVSIGAGEFQATAERLDAFPLLRGLLARRLEIRSLQLVELSLVLPPTGVGLQSAWRQVRDHIEAARRAGDDPAAAPPIASSWQIDQVLVDGAKVRFGADDADPIVATVTVSGLGAADLELAIDAEIPTTGASLTGALRVGAADGAQLRGSFTASGVHPGYWIQLPERLQSEWEAQVDLAGELERGIEAEIEGAFEPVSSGVLTGSFSGKAEIAPDGATAVALDARGEGIRLRGSARLFGGDPKLRIDLLAVRGEPLAALLEPLAAGAARIRAAPEATAELRNVDVAITGISRARLLSGHLAARGLEVSWNGEPIARDLRLRGTVAEEAIRIAELRGGPFDLRGIVTPDADWRSVQLDLTGMIGITDALLHALRCPDAIRSATGVIALEELRAGLPAPEDRPTPWSLRAQVSGGSLRVESDAISDTVSAIDVRLAGDQGSLRAEASALSAVLGPVTLSAALAPGETRLDGNLAFDVGAAAGLLRDEKARRRVGPALGVYDDSGFDFHAEWPRDGPGDVRLRIERAQPPRLAVALALGSGGEGDALGDVDVQADLPGEALRGVLPEDVRTSGSAALRLRRAASAATFTVEADLGALGVAVGEFIEKKPGEPLEVRLEGEIAKRTQDGDEEPGARWSPTRLVVASGTSAVPLPIADGEVAAPDLSLDVGAWSFLLVDAARASGRLRGSWVGDALRLELVGVALALPPDLGVDAADGEIAFDLETRDWGIRDLRVRGGQSDAALTVAVEDAQLEGRVAGARLDIDFVRALRRQIDAFVPDDDKGRPISGEFAIALDRVSYRRGEARDLAAAVEVVEDDIHIRELSFAVGEGGRVSGTVDLDNRRRGSPDLLALDLDLADVPARFVDDVVTREPRDLRGVFSGKLRFEAPVYDDVKTMMPEARGALTATGRDGSFGRLGLATQLTTVLRSTEALRMRLPALQDEGLVFDTVKADLAMEEGSVSIRAFDLDSTSYAITASGELNFREDRSKVPIEVNAIRGLTALVERVPVAGDALKIVNVRLIATGSPYAMKLRIASITDQLLGASLAGPRAVIKGVNDALRVLRGSAGSAPAPEPVPVPEPAPEPESGPAPPSRPEGAAPEPGSEPSSAASGGPSR